MTDELAAQLRRLTERSDDLAETATLPRGALPALFRAVEGAAAEGRARAATELAERLADWPLVLPTLELLAADSSLVETWAQAVLAAAEESAPWCSHSQAAGLLRLAPGDASLGLRLLSLLLETEPRDPTELALTLGVEACSEALLAVLSVRLRAPTGRRDRTSARLAQGAIRALAAIAADDPAVQREVARVVAAETRRAGSGEPTLALEALEALRAAPPIARIRLIAPTLVTLFTLKKRKVRELAEELQAAAAEELGLGDEGLAELTARTGGLDRDGVARVPLDEGAEARLSLARDGSLAVEAPANLEREDRRALEAAVRELEDARAELVRRLENALADGRTWNVPVWSAVFRGHPIWKDLAPRLSWELLNEGDQRTPFDLTPEPTTLFGEPLQLPDSARVRLLHPAELDPDELELWRERSLERGWPAPFPQLFRAAAPPSDGPFSSFSQRLAYRDDVAELARRSGWRGYPLEGKPPWELYRSFPAGELALQLTDVPPELARTALGNLTKAAKQQRKQGPTPDAKPRVRVLGVEVRGDVGPRAIAEVVKDLHDLSDGLATPSELDMRAWQKDKWREPKESWRALVLRYRNGSPARLELRRALLRAHCPQLRLEDRFAITQRHVIELGRGWVHEGVDKDYLPAWKAQERADAHAVELRLPFVPEADPETVAIVGLTLGLAAWEKATAEAEPPGAGAAGED